MPQTTEVAILGGGATGCSVAYYLSRNGVSSTIIEREGIASQASGFSAGGLNPLQGAGIPGPLGPLAIKSYRIHAELAELLQSEQEADYQWRIISLVKAAFEEADLPDLQQTIDVFKAAEGFEGEWLDPEELRKLEPRVAADVIQGVIARGNASLDSHKYTRALSQAACTQGAAVKPGEVLGLEVSKGRVTGVLLEDGLLACGQVVLAMGPWSRNAEPWLDSYIPVDPLKGEILRVELPGGPLEQDYSGGGGSLYPKPDGLVWCGTTEDWRGYDREPSESARQRILKGAARLIPEVAQSRLVRHTACLRPVTPDGLPIVGQAPGWENVYLATGAGKKGILLSPGMGQAVADLIIHGNTELPIEGMQLDRFANYVD